MSLGEFCETRLEALLGAAGFGSETDVALDTFRRLVEPSRAHPFAPARGWVSDISDDNTPIELSAAISDQGRVQVRVLFEAQGDDPTLASYRAAALALTGRLESEFGASLTRFRAIMDIFMPEEMSGPFALWHSVVFDEGRPPSFKAYFNPQARGRSVAPRLVARALSRLGMHESFGPVSQTARRGPHLDELKYFALDLSDDSRARVKVYVRHHASTPEGLEDASRGAGGYVEGEVERFVRAMGGDRDRLMSRATFTCSGFVEGQSTPNATTVYVPVCAYAQSDETVVERVAEYLSAEGMDPGPYRALISGYANRPLVAGTGMQSWVAFRRLAGARLTVYLATEAAKVFPSGSVPAASAQPFTLPSTASAIELVESYDLSLHPVLEGLAAHTEQAKNAVDAMLGVLRPHGERDHGAALDALQRAQRLLGGADSTMQLEAFSALLSSVLDAPGALGASCALEIGVSQLLHAIAAAVTPDDDTRGEWEALAQARAQARSDAHGRAAHAAQHHDVGAFTRSAVEAHAVCWTLMDAIYADRDASKESP